MVVIVLSVPAGASFTLVTLIVIVLADWSVSTPPLATPPLSLTWNVKLASGDPLAFAAGVNTSRPALISSFVATWPAETYILSLHGALAVWVGIVVISTAASA